MLINLVCYIYLILKDKAKQMKNFFESDCFDREK
jgi:hypothetical protein